MHLGLHCENNSSSNFRFSKIFSTLFLVSHTTNNRCNILCCHFVKDCNAVWCNITCLVAILNALIDCIRNSLSDRDELQWQLTNLNAELLNLIDKKTNVNDNLTKLNFRFERSKLLRTKLNWKLMKLNEEVTKMGGKTYIIPLPHTLSDFFRAAAAVARHFAPLSKHSGAALM